MKTLFIYLTIFLFSFSYALAQDYNIEWGELEGGKGVTQDIVNIGESNFFLFSQIGDYNPINFVSYYKNFKKQKSEKLIPKINGKNAEYISAEMINKKLIVFFSTSTKNRKFYYAQKYNMDLSKNGEPIELANFEALNRFLIVGKTFGGNSLIVTSENKEFFALNWEVKGEKTESIGFAYKVFNGQCEEILVGQQDLPFDPDLIRVDHHHLTNKGDYFVSIQELNSPQKKTLFKSYASNKAVHICKLGSKDFDAYEIDMKDYRLGELKINSDGSSILNLVGTFGPKGGKKHGVFNIRVDFVAKKLLTEKFTELRASTLTEKCEGINCEKRIDVSACELDDCIQMENGKLICTLERYIIKAGPRTDGVTAYLHYYNEIYTFCLNKNGEIEWMNEITKKGTGSAVSYSKFLNGNELVYIFNDNLENYNTKGGFEPKDGKIEEAKWQKQYSMAAIATVDVSNGETVRKKLFDKSEISAVAFPQKFVVDYENNEVILFCSARNKNKFGLIKLVND